MPAEYLSPIVFHQHARAFADAARREFDHVGPMDVSFPGYFLIARAIELGLKSSLLLRGYTVAQLRDRKTLGHDLVKAIEHASSGDEVANTVAISAEQREAITWINEYYATKDLEYLTTGAKSYPRPDYLLESVETILAQVEPRLRSWRPPRDG